MRFLELKDIIREQGVVSSEYPLWALMEWANGDHRELWVSEIDIVKKKVPYRFTLSPADILSGLKVLSRRILGEMIRTVESAKNSGQVPKIPEPIFWKRTLTVEAIGWGTDGFCFGFATEIEALKLFPEWKMAMPGWDVPNEAFMVFNQFIRDESLVDPNKVRFCAISECERFFVPKRGGQKSSKTCSKAHALLLSSRKQRQNDSYRNRERKRNRDRMQTVREGEKLFFKWIGEGRSHREAQSMLRKWNESLSSPLGEKALQNILDK